MEGNLIDRIYESAFVPELWRGVLADMAEIATARAGFLFISKAEIHRWTSSTQIGIDALKPLVESGWIARSERFRRLLTARDAGFLSDAVLYPTGGLETDPFYRDILYPRGLGHAAAIAVLLPTGDSFTISLERELESGPINSDELRALNFLRPHLARSGMLSTRLELEKARATSQVLASLGLAALVFDHAGRIIDANALIEAMTAHVTWRAQDRLALNDRQANLFLDGAITAIERTAPVEVSSFPVRDPDGNAAMIAHVVPIRRSARDIFARCAGVLVMTPVAAPHALPVELVKSLFDLTPSESRVAYDLAEGGGIDDIAAKRGVSINTVRTHVRGILEKTGCNRTIDLVALLTRIASSTPVSS